MGVWGWTITIIVLVVLVLYRVAQLMDAIDRKKYKIKRFQYLTGHPDIRTDEKGFAMFAPSQHRGHIFVVPYRGTKLVRELIPYGFDMPIESINWVHDVRLVKSGEDKGATGLLGAAIGGVIAGPEGAVLGAIAGKRNARDKLANADMSVSIIQTVYHDMQIQVYLRCTAEEHTDLLKLLNFDSSAPKKEKKTVHSTSTENGSSTQFSRS